MEDTNLKNVPPVSDVTRNGYGLLNRIDYVFDESGFVNWRKMLRPQDLALNRQKKEEIEKTYGKNFNEIDIIKDNVDDKYVVILLSGIRYLMAIRGFKECSFDYNSSEDRASARCRIQFIGNYETNNEEVRFESTAERSKFSTVRPFNNFLVSLAENAALARCVRNFLRIATLANDEILGFQDNAPDQTEESDPTSPHAVLEKLLKANNWSYGQLQKALTSKVDEKNERVYPEAETWQSVKDIPKSKVLGIIGTLQKLNKK